MGVRETSRLIIAEDRSNMAATSGARNFFHFLRENKYAVYVLVILMLTFLVNQLNTFLLVATNASMAKELKYGDRVCSPQNETSLNIYLELNKINQSSADYCRGNEQICNTYSNGTSWCSWDYIGTGFEYQLLAGPLYIVLFAISGIPLGMVSELNNFNRKYFLAACVVGWSTMTVLAGFSQQYWHVAVTRLALGIFSAGCVPFCVSLLSDYFTKEQRGAAIGFFNWGIYVGYSLTFVFLIAVRQLGWRYVYFIAGAPGFIFAALILFTVKEKTRKEAAVVVKSDAEQNNLRAKTAKLREALKTFSNPALLLLCLGGALRNGGGIVWAYNIKNFFSIYHPTTKLEVWNSWIPLVFGSIGSFGGGAISDRLSRNLGTKGRMFVLFSCVFVTSPIVVGTLFLPMPYLLITHILTYVIGEMWMSVCMAVVVDLVPGHLTTSSIAVYFFALRIIGGNMPLFISPISKSLNLRIALLITFPGLYFLGAVFFLLTFVVLVCQSRKQGKGDISPGADNPALDLTQDPITDGKKIDKEG